MIGVHVRTPAWLYPLIMDFYDPTPWSGDGLAIPNPEPPSSGQPIWWNGDYSRLDEWVGWLIKKHQEGHFVIALIPMGDSEEVRELIRYGIRRFIPDRRIFSEVRNVELVILTG